MIDLYSWQTPNGRKVSIMLEEIGMDYNVFPINIGKDEQFQPHFLEIKDDEKCFTCRKVRRKIFLQKF